MSKSLRGFKWLVGTVVGVSLLGACGAPADGDTAPTEATDQAQGALTATVSVPKASMAANETVTVQVTLTNTSSAPVSLHKWEVPGTGLTEGRLSVMRDGQSVAYTGAHYKRVLGRPEDVVTLAPGESLSGPVVVSDVYDLSVTGTYAIRYELEERASVTALASNEVRLFIEGRRNSREETQAMGQVTAQGLSYSGACTSSEQGSISTAFNSAKTYSTNSLSYLNGTPSATTRFTTWFGTYSTTNWGTIRTNFSKIKTAFDSANVVVDCSCNESGTYAYVYSNAPYKIYVCGAFWNAPNTGTDSRAGTLVHEMSHFTVVAGTSDYAYGQSAAKNLARTNPARARANADSHEYFTENTPSLP
ncbi:M35 family metallo-endopeptidase [Corallococcus sp. BB11-1]|uniref:M35 family metallo-endopeptidase n=1 Tax=Corallococcus sp. BB11-1 TaxID=2996783 RepID=UPI0022705B6C|nr:M35 family metallo-endopeptidase [Corallococcus sp. BB11-1]MCY1031642.1 M35 family metallo-endopeptidase [Corallococcus sp. BB11-1]